MTALAQRYFDFCATRPRPQLIIDTDPGVDDAAALLLAFGLERLGYLDVLGITTVAGNVSLHKASKNARVIADWAKRSDVAIHAGAEKPLLMPLHSAEHIHGITGLGNAQLHKPQTNLQPQAAVPYLIELLNQAEPYSVTLCAIGPLTNIAQLLSLSPLCARGIKEIVVMGGNFLRRGNVTPMAEFNFYTDPHAAQMVLQSGVPLRIVPLDVTHQVLLNPEHLKQLSALDNVNGPQLAALLQDYMGNEKQDNAMRHAPLHDPCAILCALMPSLFEQKRVHVDIETHGKLTNGACVVDWDEKFKRKPNAYWTHKADSEAIFEILIQAIAALP